MGDFSSYQYLPRFDEKPPARMPNYPQKKSGLNSSLVPKANVRAVRNPYQRKPHGTS